jgi:small ligand-binding sensory domain FIST
MTRRSEDLESLLFVAERELSFLVTHLEDHPEIATTPAGALLLTCLEGGLAMAGRLRSLHKVSGGSERP